MATIKSALELADKMANFSLQNNEVHLPEGMTVDDMLTDYRAEALYSLNNIANEQLQEAKEQNVSLLQNNNQMEEQNHLLLQNYNQLKESFDIQKEQLVETKKQNTMLQEQLEQEIEEKEKAKKAEKRNKPWSIAGKTLSLVVGLIAFVITVIVALYPDKCKEIIDVAMKIILSQG